MRRLQPLRDAGPWALVGLVAGGAGLGTSYFISALMNQRLSPVTAVAELVIRYTPGGVASNANQAVGSANKPLLFAGILVFLALAFAVIGAVARNRFWAGALGFALLAGFGVWATLRLNGATALDLVPVLIGFATWVIALSALAPRLRLLHDAAPGSGVRAAGADPSTDEAAGSIEITGAELDAHSSRRRTFLMVVGAIAGVGGVSAAAGRIAGSGRRKVEQARRLLRLPVTQPPPVDRFLAGVEGSRPWMTPASDFYLIDTAAIPPNIAPKDWRLRIHGMVENELELTFDDLINRPVEEAWITLNCVSNPVGGELIGNAWWSGVRLDAILAEAGPLPEADALLQTSEDGWTCGTPLDVVLDGRNAMLAVAMNGRPLTVEHGFPVRTIVPGLYGYVSATKWVVDIEVSRFEDFTAFWTDKGWSEQGPVKIASRIEVPRAADQVAVGTTVVAGTAWSQHTGIAAVEVALDGGAWQSAELARTPNDDTWVQWRIELELPEGRRAVRVRATGKDGEVQTGTVREVMPDGATGWHEVQFDAV